MKEVNKKCNVIVLDNSEQMRKMIKDYFNNSEEVSVVAEFENATKALDFLQKNEVDVVLSDVVLPGIDGFEFLEKLKILNLKNTPKIIMLSALSGDGFIQKALNLGANYYMVKPCEMNLLKSRILELNQNGSFAVSAIANESKNVASIHKNKQLEEKITNIFITVGIPAHIKGYQFLREAIKMAIDNPEIINSITKKLYPSIAERFDTSASKVERAIRHAIEVAWNRGKIENINALFGVRVYSNNEKPTNGEFIALVADKMLIEGA